MTGLMFKISGGWLLALLAGLPMYVSMGLAVLAFLWLGGFPVTMLPQKMAGSVNSFPLVAAPLFILMGNILGAARLTDRIVDFASAIIGWVRGGYAHASVLSSMIFAGMVGSAVADAAGSGAIEIRAMKKAGYKPETAASITAAAATIGPIIPPSLPMVIYGVSADVSVGRLFMAGVVPGVLMGVTLMIMVAFVARAHGMARQPFGGWMNVARSFARGFFALMTPVVILGGMFSGIFTPTEAAAVSVLYALVVGSLIYREIKLKDLYPILRKSVISSAVIMFIIANAGLFAFLITRAGVPGAIGQWLEQVLQSPFFFLLGVNVALFIIGMFIETGAAIIVLAPILVPVAVHFGIDPIHFGMVMVVNLALGMVTPPFGVNLFAACTVARISLDRIIKDLIPFIGVVLACLMLISYIPEISLTLRDLVYKK